MWNEKFAKHPETSPKNVKPCSVAWNLEIRNGDGKQGRGNQPPIDDTDPIRKFSIDPGCHTDLQNPAELSPKGKPIQNFSIDPASSIWTRLRTPFLRTPFPRLLWKLFHRYFFTVSHLQFLKARSLQCGFWQRNSQILIWILPWIFGWIFSSCSSQGKGPEKIHPKNPPLNSPRTLFGQIPLGFLQKPSLDNFKHNFKYNFKEPFTMRISRARKPWSANCELKHWNFRGWKCLIHGLHFTV